MNNSIKQQAEISVADLKNKKSNEYVLIDIRDGIVYRHGFIPHAVSMPWKLSQAESADAEQEKKRAFLEKLASLAEPDKPLIVYCQRGEESRAVADFLAEEGYEAYNLEGGYLKWLIASATEVNMERYSRHLLLSQVGLEGQKKLLDSRVLIIGAGGLGAPAALYLAAAGVGTIGIVDDDKVELSNLQRQIIHTTQNVGKEKVESAKETLGKINPDVSVIPYHKRVTPENVEALIDGYDFILDGVDNFETKFLINDACVIAKKPFCHAGILQFQGQVMTYVPGKGPCYRCIFEEIPESGSIPSCKEAGVLGVMGGILGSLQALEALKYLLGIGELLTGRMLVFDGLSMKFREAKFSHSSPDCRVCGKDAPIKDVKDNADEYAPKGCSL